MRRASSYQKGARREGGFGHANSAPKSLNPPPQQRCQAHLSLIAFQPLIPLLSFPHTRPSTGKQEPSKPGGRPRARHDHQTSLLKHPRPRTTPARGHRTCPGGDCGVSLASFSSLPCSFCCGPPFLPLYGPPSSFNAAPPGLGHSSSPSPQSRALILFGGSAPSPPPPLLPPLLPYPRVTTMLPVSSMKSKPPSKAPAVYPTAKETRLPTTSSSPSQVGQIPWRCCTSWHGFGHGGTRRSI